MHWETRYSACEMLHLDVVGDQVRSYLDTPASAHCYTFQQVLEGAMDNEVRAVFGGDVLDEIKAIAKRELKRAASRKRTDARGSSLPKSTAHTSAAPVLPTPVERESKREETWGADAWSSAKPVTGKASRSPSTPPKSKP